MPGIPKDGVVSEIWHGSKWRHELDRHALSPMYDAGDRHYYIDEPAQLTDGRTVIPIRWLEDDDNVVWFEAWKVVCNEEVSGEGVIVFHDALLTTYVRCCDHVATESSDHCG